MKNIIQKFKNWLILKLGGFTIQNVERLTQEHIQIAAKLYVARLIPWERTVQEICRRSENSYYDWCCEYCKMTCDKRDGWCERFCPVRSKLREEEK